MSHKIQIVLPDPQADQLAELAAGPAWQREAILPGVIHTPPPPRPPTRIVGLERVVVMGDLPSWGPSH
jgi:hypothetical protein